MRGDEVKVLDASGGGGSGLPFSEAISLYVLNSLVNVYC